MLFRSCKTIYIYIYNESLDAMFNKSIIIFYLQIKLLMKIKKRNHLTITKSMI